MCDILTKLYDIWRRRTSKWARDESVSFNSEDLIIIEEMIAYVIANKQTQTNAIRIAYRG